MKIKFACPIYDTHCGMRAISKDALDRLPLSQEGMEFASEFIVEQANRRYTARASLKPMYDPKSERTRS